MLEGSGAEEVDPAVVGAAACGEKVGVVRAPVYGFDCCLVLVELA